METINQVLSQLGQELGMQGLHLEADDAIRLELADEEQQLEMFYDEDDDALILTSDLGRWPELDTQKLRMALMANHLWTDSPVAIAIRPDDEHFVVLTSIPQTRLSMDLLREAICNVVNNAMVWSEVFSTEQTADASPSASSGPGAMRI